MVTIEIDEATADGLERQAKQAGVTLVDYLRSLVVVDVPKERPSWDELEKEFIRLSIGPPNPRPSWDEIEQEAMELSLEGGTEGFIPDDFSRADIYDDHD